VPPTPSFIFGNWANYFYKCSQYRTYGSQCCGSGFGQIRTGIILLQCCGSMTFWGWIRIRIRIRGSMPLTNGSGSWIRNPAIFVIDLQDASKKLIF
jgi:hypothetical protein